MTNIFLGKKWSDRAMEWRDKQRRARLKDLRSEKDISQERMARLLGISRATFIRKEAEYSFTIQEIDRMADILKTTTSTLLEEKC